MIRQEALQIFSVSQINQYLKGLLDQDALLNNIWIRGEISNFKHHSRGHMYFTLKDAESRITAVMFAGTNRFLRFTPDDGQKVIARGSISVYERDGQYQLYVKEMQPDGIGNLYLAFEEMKRELAAKGYFRAERKRPLPPFPKRIALVTSPTGAAIRDMITTLRRRYPLVKILLIPVLVQGEKASRSIAQGIELANRYGGIDLIITGRGGGSIEELWAFNEKVVAEAIYHSAIPVISAVGHETDYTIADFVADLRAPTPTAAAELAVPHIAQLSERVALFLHRGRRALLEGVRRRRQGMERLSKSPILRRPLSLVEGEEQRLDKLLERLERSERKLLKLKTKEISGLKNRLFRSVYRLPMGKERQRFQTAKVRLSAAIKRLVEREKKGLYFQISHLESLSPLSILKRGYTLVYNEKEELIQSVRQLSPGESITVRFKDGRATATVWGIYEEEEQHG